MRLYPQGLKKAMTTPTSAIFLGPDSELQSESPKRSQLNSAQTSFFRLLI